MHLSIHSSLIPIIVVALNIVFFVSSLNVAIIGSGIGGASASYHIKDLIPEADITVFERGASVGGRLRSVKFNETNVELGGSIAVKANQYFHDLTSKLNLTISPPLSVPGSYAISNGTHLIFQGSSSFLGSWSKMLYNYGLSPVMIAPKVSGLVSDFSQIYYLLDQGVSFRSSRDLWEKLSLLSYTEKTLQDALSESLYFNFYPFMTSSFIEEFVSSITHINYLQSPNSMHSLAGLIAITPLYSGKENIFRIEEGNSELIIRLFKGSGAKVLLDHGVTKILKFISQDSNMVQWNITVADNSIPYTFDAVILAAPLELANIDILDDDIGNVISSRQYQRVHTTILKGELQPGYFGVNFISEIPTTVGATRNVPFASFSILHEIGNGEHLVKLFSEKPLPDSLLKRIFKGDFKQVANATWDAYPQFHPGLEMMNFSLSERFYYLNAIESGGSCIEISTISGRNAALLLKQDVGQDMSSKLLQQKSSPLGIEAEKVEL